MNRPIERDEWSIDGGGGGLRIERTPHGFHVYAHSADTGEEAHVFSLGLDEGEELAAWLRGPAKEVHIDANL